MKKRSSFVAAILAAGCMVIGMTGCGSRETGKQVSDAANGSNDTEVASDTSESGAEDLSGTITLAGSTSMEKLCEAMSESFMQDYPNVTVTVEYTGSGAGLESLASGSVDIGNASRALKEEELANGIVENVVAIDGIAVITSPNNTVTNIKSDDLKKIYTGEITNWSDLGGNDEAIVVIGREAGSGTRDAFEELLDVADACAYAQELDSTGAVKAKVASTPGAIGYVSLDVVDDTILTVSLDDVEPTEEEILAGNYLLSRPFVMATKGAVEEQDELVQTWFEYVDSETGEEVIAGAGLIIPE